MNKNTDSIYLDEPIKHKIGGKVFIVTPVFKESASETIGTVLLRLMKKEVEPPP